MKNRKNKIECRDRAKIDNKLTSTEHCAAEGNRKPFKIQDKR
jgi:hypothetical protein